MYLDDVCNFIPPKNHPGELEFIHFVYETGVRRLSQPFSHFYHRVYLVFKGTGVLKCDGRAFSLVPGRAVFVQGGRPYEIDFDDDLCYFYISFCGRGALSLLESVGITRENCLFDTPEQVRNMWVDSVRRICPANANTLTESVLMYTLSFVQSESQPVAAKPADKFDIIMDYIDRNFTAPDMSLSKIADIFYYTEKHLSYLFSSRVGVRFTKYVTDLRLDYAEQLIKNGCTSVAEVAAKCGFGDRFYFSKVFKKATGKTPTEYMKQK